MKDRKGFTLIEMVASVLGATNDPLYNEGVVSRLAEVLSDGKNADPEEEVGDSVRWAMKDVARRAEKVAVAYIKGDRHFLDDLLPAAHEVAETVVEDCDVTWAGDVAEFDGEWALRSLAIAAVTRRANPALAAWFVHSFRRYE